MEVKYHNYAPQRMTVADAYLPREKGEFMMFADYEQAKGIITKLLGEKKEISHAVMGLDGDWSWNSTVIYDDENGHTPYDCHEGSFWAEPIVIIYYYDGSNEAYSCWKKEK